VGEAKALSTASPGAHAPKVEELPVWLASLEALFPFGPVVFSGEWYYGEGTYRHSGGMLQRERIDPTTGRHRFPVDTGGWGQLLWHTEAGHELGVYGGYNRVLKNLVGRADRPALVDLNSTERIQANAVAGLITYGGWLAPLYLSWQGFWLRTRYKAPEAMSEGYGVMLGAQYRF
jgi:hypothetical protein